MSKRLTDTDKWKKLWFRKLKPEHKIFWQYLLDTCNNAGIWEVDFEMASFMIGCDVDPEEIKQLFSKQYRELDDGKRWFIEDFIEFQYKCSIQDLNPGNKAHLSVIRILEKHNIKGLQSPLEGANQKQEAPIQGALDKDMDKEKDKDKEEEKDKEKESRHNHGINNHVLLTDTNYSELCDRYGKQLADEYIQKVDDYCENHGKSYTNWTNAVHTFIRNDVKRGKLKLETPKEKKICPECGGDMLGGVCMKCGWSKSRPGKIE